MIKASALLVALAIGLLVAGVVASSLLMVYVSIGVCAVAALLLAAGVLSHWSEIFGRREARPVSQGAWSEPQVNVTAPVLASIQAVAAARGSGRPGREDAGLRADGGRAPETPAELVSPPAEVAGRGAEFPAPRRSDELWERVDEELGSAARRDTGALSWPGTVFPPVAPDASEPAEPGASAPGAGPQGQRAGTGAWLWGSGTGWQPPENAEPVWPPPAAAFAESKAAQKSAEPERAESEPEPAEPEPAGAEPAGAEPAEAEPAEAEPDEPAADAARDTDVAQDAEADLGDDEVPGDGVVLDDEAARGDEAAGDAGDHEAADDDAAEPAVQSTPGEPAGGDSPQWIVAPSRPAGQEPPARTPPGQPPAAQETTAEEAVPQRSAVQEPAAEPPGGDDSGADDSGPDALGADARADAQGADAPGPDDLSPDAPAAGEPADKQPAAQEPAVEQPAPGAPEPAVEEPSGDGAAATPAPGRVEVTVVPGVARYHRSECILIRFLSDGDLEIMTKQEAVDAKFIACRACQPDQLED